MPKSNKSQIFTFRAGRWSPAFFLLGLLLACGGGGGGDQLNLNDLGCDSMPSAPKTEACAGGQLGTHTFQTETASCSANNGKIIVDDTQACLANTPSNRIALALKEGDSRILKAEDAAPLMERAYQSYKLKIQTNNKFLDDFYKSDSETPFAMVKESFLPQAGPTAYDQVFPFVVGDKGNVLASVSTFGGNRIAAYGYDILSGFDLSNSTPITDRPRQTAHIPVIKRVLAWLVKGDASVNWSNQAPANLNIAWGSLPTTSTTFTTPSVTNLKKPRAAAGLTALGIPYTNLDCDPLSAAVKDCAAKAQLVVLGASDQSSAVKPLLPTQLQRIQEIMAAKIPILYLSAHPSGGAVNDWAGKQFSEDFDRLKAMGFAYGLISQLSNLSNYYPEDSVRSGLSLVDMKKRVNPIEGVLTKLNGTTPHLTYTWEACPDKDDCPKPQGFIDDIETPTGLLKGYFDIANTSAVDIFRNSQLPNTLSLLALWADAYRLSIKYPLIKTEPEKFQGAYVSEAIVSYFRAAAAGQPDLGNLLPASANSVVGNATPENVNVTLPGSAGTTSIGRFALPGQAVTIKLVNAPSAGTFSFYINTAEESNTKLFASAFDSANKPDLSSGYRRPRLPQSTNFSISTQPVTIVSPYGGLMQLRFSGASVSAVTLQIQGVSKHPFYDTTQPGADKTVFFNDVKTSKLGWMEIKTRSAEIHSLISKSNQFLMPDASDASNTSYPNSKKAYYTKTDGINMEKYLNEIQSYVMDGAYGFAGIQAGGLRLNDYVSKVCEDLLWDCSPTIHKPPTIQHFHHDDVARCGWMCSGNPISSGAGFDPRGWGESHEMGHNLQSFRIYGGMSGEVSNNIFPLQKKWRLLRELGRDAIGYYNELDHTFDTFQAIRDNSNKSTAAQVSGVKAAIWTGGGSAAQNRSQLNFYVQWPILYYEVLKSKYPLWSDTQAWDRAWDIYTLLYLHERQVKALTASNWDANKQKFGFSANELFNSGRFSDETSYHDYLMTALSQITGRNQATLFNMWGVQTNATAQAAIASKNYAAQDPHFYAVVCSDDFRSYQRVDMSIPTPTLKWTQEQLTTKNQQACTDATKALLGP